jgi:hypothetical protein
MAADPHPLNKQEPHSAPLEWGFPWITTFNPFSVTPASIEL